MNIRYLPTALRVSVKRIDPRGTSLVEWLADHDANLENFDQPDDSMFKLIDEHIHMMDILQSERDKLNILDDIYCTILKEIELDIYASISAIKSRAVDV